MKMWLFRMFELSFDYLDGKNNSRWSPLQRIVRLVLMPVIVPLAIVILCLIPMLLYVIICIPIEVVKWLITYVKHGTNP